MKKRLNSISLRARITLLTGVVILAVSLALTLTSIHNAQDQFIYDTVPEKAGEAQLEAGDNGTDRELTPQQERGDVILMPDPVTLQANRAFKFWSILSLLIFSSLGMGLTWILAGRALLPLRKLETAVSDISAQNLSDRLPAPESRDEVGRLTDAFNRMLDRLEQSFDQQKRFSSSVAHELKTPLTTMKLSLQEARIEGREDDELLAVTERSVDRLTGVVASLLELTNESTEGLDERFVLCFLLREIAAGLAPLYPSAEVGFSLPDHEVTVTGSSTLVRRLFENLIENAMKYNVSGGRVDIALTEEPDGVRVTVSDNGAGIPEASLPHIFEPFYCVDPSRSRKLGGAGLGLSVAQMVAHHHGWALTAENRPEGGAVFIVVITK